MSLGAFTQGLQGGIKSMSDLRKARQDENIRDILIRGAMDEEGARGTAMEDASMEPYTGGLVNPWIEKFLGSFGKSKRNRIPRGEVTVGDMAATAPIAEAQVTPEEDPFSSQYYRDGGKVRRAIPMADGGDLDPEEVKRLAAEARARNPAEVSSRTTSVDKPIKGATDNPFGNVDTKGEGRVGGPSRAHNTRRLLDRAASSKAGKLGTGFALGATAAKVYNTPTEDYRERFGLETNDPSFLGDLGVRTLGAASDLGSVLTGGLADNLYRDKRRQAIPTASSAPAATAAPDAAPASSTAGASVSAPSSSPAAPRKALPAAGEGEDSSAMALEDVDFSGLSPEEIPDFKTRDWVDFREKAFRDLIARGVPVGDAMDKVDMQVTSMQQRAFTNFAMQALALQEAGDIRGAMAAIYGAFQMFPSGTNVQLGVHNGRIVGVGVDEETGQPVGQPMLLDSERIAAIVDNFRQPEAWNHWAKDRRDFQMALRKYVEMEKPLAEAQASSMLTTANAAATRANADMVAAQSSGGAGGMRPADMARSERVYRDRLEMLMMQDPRKADEIAAKMSELKRRNPSAPDNMIMMYVMDRAGYGPQE